MKIFDSLWFYLCLLILFVGILYGSFIFSDKMLYGTDTLAAGYHDRLFLKEQLLKTGSVPQWDPYVWGGVPFVDSISGDIFYPLSVIRFALEVHRYMGWMYIIHIFIAFFGMYLCARGFNITKYGAILSALAYASAPFLLSLVHAGHDGKTFVVALYPLSIYFLNKALFSPKNLSTWSLFALVYSFMLLSPHLQLCYYAGWSYTLFILYKIVFERVHITAKSIGFISAVVLAIGISAIQFYPSYVYTSEWSNRATTQKGIEWASSWSMSWMDAAGILIPDYAGHTLLSENNYWGKNALKEHSEYFGAIVFILAILGVLTGGRLAIFWGVISGMALLFAFGNPSPIFHLAYVIAPMVSSMRAPSLIMFLFTFGCCLCAGWGFDRSHTNGYLLLFGGALVLIFTFTVIGNSPITLIFLSVVCLIPPLVIKYKQALLITISILLLVSNLIIASKYVHVFDQNNYIIPTELVDYLKDNSYNSRVLDNTQQSNYLAAHGVFMANGYKGNLLVGSGKVETVQYLLEENKEDRSRVNVTKIGDYIPIVRCVGGDLDTVVFGTDTIKITATLVGSGCIEARMNYYDQWKYSYKIDTLEISGLTPEKMEYGYKIPCDSGVSEITLYYEPTRYLIGKVVTLISLFIFSITLGFGVIDADKRK